MKLSLFTVSFAGLWGQDRLDLDECVDTAAELGYDGVEIMGKRPHLSPLDFSVDDCRRLRDGLERGGLSCSAVAAYTNFTGGTDAPEVPFGEMQVGYVTALAERAAALGSDLVRIFTSYEVPGRPWFGQWEGTVRAVRECADRAAEFGVNLGIQNHHDIAVVTRVLDEFLRQVDRPNVAPMWDCWSAHLLGESLPAGAEAMAGRMRFTTAADYVVLPRARYRSGLVGYEHDPVPAALAVPMGEGDLDYQTFFKALVANGYDGWASYEMCSPIRDGGSLETLQRYAAQFVEYMRPWTAPAS